jgi:LmbE family N-acetylglucosaminyl deacetylase
MNFKHFLIIALLISLAPLTKAQAPKSYNSAEILQQLQQLKVLGSVLYVGAHPDDENTRLLAYLAREKKYRTAYLSLTRGDGGQNLVGDEQGIELGLMRTQELLAARRVDGAEQFFSRAYDFGFSKSPKEALSIWNHDTILADVVWVIRQFQPDVIITRFPEDGRAGHGHHSASAILAREAFTAAADSTKFPEQFLYGVKPWKAKRILWNTFSFGNVNTTSDTQYKMDIGAYNEVLGKSYGEIAAESRSQHKSQGFGVAAVRGSSTEYFLTTGGDAPVNDLLDGVNTDWSRIGQPEINASVDSLIASYNPLHPSASLPDLERLTAQVQSLPLGYWRTYKLKQLHTLENACSGLWMEAFVQQPYLVRGSDAVVTVSLINRGPDTIHVSHIMVGFKDSVINATLPRNQTVNYSFPIFVPEDKPLSQPYWLREEKTEGHFTVSNQFDIGMAQNEAPISAWVGLEQHGNREAQLPVMYKHTDPVRGELYQPLEITPPILLYFTPGTILDNLDPSFHPKLKATIIAMQDIDAQNLSFTLDNAQQTKSMLITKGATKLIKGKSYEYELPYDETFMKSARGGGINIGVLVTYNKQNSQTKGKPQLVNGTYSTGMKEIDYPHIPFIHYFHGTGSTVIGEQVKVHSKRVGYIMGAGDKVPACLELMGIEVTMLRQQDIQSADLSRYDAIITGVRAFNTQTWLADVMPKLMAYVKDGGVLVEQYNNFNGLVTPDLGPYPFHVGGGRVTDESAEVQFLDPANPALHYPNEITNEDFAGWVQERGLYYVDVPDQLDDHYKTVLGMKDKGEDNVQKGSLITTAYGKGKFVYTSLAFFRELPAGVPGAYRLFANLMAKPAGQ